MDRRAFLAATTGSLAGIAGCTSFTRSTPAGNGEPTDETVITDQPSPVSPTATQEPFSVELRQVEYVAHGYQPSSGRGIDPDDIVPEVDIPAVLREALYQARDGEFESETISDALLAAIDEFRKYATGVLVPYAELEGTAYEFDPSVPTFVAELEAELLDDYDEDRLLREDDWSAIESEAVRTFVRALTVQGTEIPRSDYRRSLVPDAVSAFLEEYDYLEDPRGVSRIKTTVRHADPPYTITIRELTPEDRWGRPVVEEADLDAELIEFFDRVLDSKHRQPAMPTPNRWQYFTDEVPEAYADIAGAYEAPPYYRLDGTVYSIGVGQPIYDRIPVTVRLEDVDAVERSFKLTVSPAPSATDDAVEGPYTFASRGALPSAVWVLDDGERYRLDDPGNPLRARKPENEVLETIHANEEISATYRVPEDLPEGRYTSRGMFRVSWSIPGQTPGDSGAYPFELQLSIRDL